MKKPRVLLADDHTFVLEGFKKLLEEQCDLVGSVEDGRALVEAAVKLQPDLVILDISMPRLNGIAAAKKLKVACAPDTIFGGSHQLARKAIDDGVIGKVQVRFLVCGSEPVSSTDWPSRSRQSIT